MVVKPPKRLQNKETGHLSHEFLRTQHLLKSWGFPKITLVFPKDLGNFPRSGENLGFFFLFLKVFCCGFPKTDKSFPEIRRMGA